MKYYGTDEQERLDDDLNDCLIKEIDDLIKGNEPDTITIYEYEQEKAELDIFDILNHTYEFLDDNYGDMDGDPTDIPDVVKEKAKELVDLILETYHVFRCERTGVRFEVDVKRFMAGECNTITMVNGVEKTIEQLEETRESTGLRDTDWERDG